MSGMQRVSTYLSLLISFAAAFGAGIVGWFFTSDAVHTWYLLLKKPPLTPPAAVFAPVWSVLYALMAVAAWRVYRRQSTDPNAESALWFYAYHLFVNALWSIIFFGFHAPLAGLFGIMLLAIYVTAIMRAFLRIDPIAGWLLLPYLLWVLFATYLNFGILLLN